MANLDASARGSCGPTARAPSAGGGAPVVLRHPMTSKRPWASPIARRAPMPPCLAAVRQRLASSTTDPPRCLVAQFIASPPRITCSKKPMGSLPACGRTLHRAEGGLQVRGGESGMQGATPASALDTARRTPALGLLMAATASAMPCASPGPQHEHRFAAGGRRLTLDHQFILSIHPLHSPSSIHCSWPKAKPPCGKAASSIS